MGKIYTSADQLIGNTPLLELTHIEKEFDLKATLLAKLEYLNPAGSIKDRVGKAMIEEAEKSGVLTKDSVIIEPTSGNTGIGLAAVATAKGYRAIIVMPETMSEERRRMISAYGAELVLTDGAKGMAGAIAKAEELAKEIPGGFVAGQFVNPVNPKAHFETTGPEIYRDTDGTVDILDTNVYDEIITVEDEQAFSIGSLIGKKEGILVGISSGAALYAAIEVAKREENKGKTVVVILPDSGDRYLSTEMFA